MAGLCSDEGLMQAAFADARELYDGDGIDSSQRSSALTAAAQMYSMEDAALN